MRPRSFRLPERYDLAGTLGSLALIRYDRTLSVSATQAWWATRTPDGPGTLHLARAGDELVATGFGPGAGWLLDRADRVAGLRDELAGFATVAGRHPLVRRLAQVHRGRRMPRTGRIFPHLVPAVLGQKVSGVEAYHSYLALLRHFGEPAPGPHPRLVLPPDPAAVAATPYWVLHPFGIERRRADTLRGAAARAAALESPPASTTSAAAPESPTAAEAGRRLRCLPGIGPWTAAEVVRLSHGDPDVVTLGDYHLPHIVSYALAGEARGDDDRMLELLAPFAGHRGRVCQLIAAAGITAPRFGPRRPLRSFARY